VLGFMMLSALYDGWRLSGGVVQPGWLYAWLYVGILAPLAIGLRAFAGLTRRAEAHDSCPTRL
jgi:hypothetical protein